MHFFMRKSAYGYAILCETKGYSLWRESFDVAYKYIRKHRIRPAEKIKTANDIIYHIQAESLEDFKNKYPEFFI